MGKVKIDIEKDSREYSIKYALNDAAGVKMILRDRYRLASRRFHAADYAACDILIDLNSAIESAGLTTRQIETVAYVFGKWQLTQKEAASAMSISQQAVAQSLDEACTRIAAVYANWNYGELTVNYEEEGGDGNDAG